jgi:hypothetical protein
MVIAELLAAFAQGQTVGARSIGLALALMAATLVHPAYGSHCRHGWFYRPSLGRCFLDSAPEARAYERHASLRALEAHRRRFAPFIRELCQALQDSRRHLETCHLSSLYQRFPHVSQFIPPSSWSTNQRDLKRRDYFSWWQTPFIKIHDLPRLFSRRCAPLTTVQT